MSDILAQLAGDFDSLESSLDDLAESISVFQKNLLEMPKHVDPLTFFRKIRPFLSGTKSGKYAEWRGIVFEGVSNTPLLLTGKIFKIKLERRIR